VGYIDFDQNNTAQVFTPYQGRVRSVFADVGEPVKKGQPLFSIDSPDLIQAESNLISAAGVWALTTKALNRAKQMREVDASAQKDVEQSTSDQQTAEGNMRAARDALRIFGKTDSEIAAVLGSRKVEGELRIMSPFAGQVTARNVAPGLLVQPGNAPAPFSVSRTSTLWMIATVLEDDLPKIKLGQSVEVRVNAFPDRSFKANIANVATTIDPNTHRAAVRAEIDDPDHLLRAQMLATFSIRTGDAQHSVGVPNNAVVREGDGTMIVFVTADGKRFARRPVTLGAEQDRMHQITDGLKEGEQIASDGALFLSNALALQSR